MDLLGKFGRCGPLAEITAPVSVTVRVLLIPPSSGYVKIRALSWPKLQRGQSPANGADTHSLSLMNVGVSTLPEHSELVRVCGLSPRT